jgi:signal transduction histidine kinase
MEFAKSRILIYTAATLLVVYLVLLLGTTFHSQGQLNQAARQSLSFELEKRASALSYFYSERRADIERLATDNALAVFFSNRALGMSMEYGLRASLLTMRQLAAAIIDTRRLDGAPIYRRLIIQDLEGEILVDKGEDAGAAAFWSEASATEAASTELLVTFDPEPKVYVRAAVTHRETPVAIILALIDQEVVSDRLVRSLSEDEPHGIMLMARSALETEPPPTDSQLAAWVERLPPGWLEHLPKRLLERLIALASEPKPERLAKPIADTPFELVFTGDPQHAGGILASRLYFYALAFLALALLGLLGFMAVQIQTRETALVSGRDALAEANARLLASQRQLVQSEKMASLGTLAAGVAHEINNPMGFIQGNLSTLDEYQRVLRGLVEDYRALVEARAEHEPELQQRWDARLAGEDIDFLLEDIESLVADSLEGSRRVAAIVAGLRNFAHSGESREESVDINECVRAALTIAGNELKFKADVVYDPGELPSIRGNTAQITQVLVNLLVNAAQAIEDWGQIHIETEVEGRFMVVHVRDTGRGIEPQHLDQLFTPFFTTKPVGSGTGLGLSISHGVVESHGGHIQVESEPGQGSRFSISLPISGVGRANP